MSDEKRPILRIISLDENEQALARNYWNGESDGRKWQWHITVQELASMHGLQKKDVIPTVRRAATATDKTVLCVDCREPKELSSRTSFTEVVYGDYICTRCRNLRTETLNRKRKAQADELDARKYSIIYEQGQGQFDYNSIEYLDAILVYAIMQASDTACETGEFEDSDSLHLCPSRQLSGKILGRLFNKGILLFDIGTPPDAIEIASNNSWTYYPSRVTWRFAPDTRGQDFARIMASLGTLIDRRQGHLSYDQSVTELWWLLAFDDAVQFLSTETSTYRIPDYKRGPKTDLALRHALNCFSIPQVRRQILNAVKNAAALSVSRDFNKRHALNTIPGSIISYVDRAVSEQWQVYPVLNNWENEEPILTKVLFNRVFGTGLPGFKTLSGSMLKSLESSEGQADPLF